MKYNVNLFYSDNLFWFSIFYGILVSNNIDRYILFVYYFVFLFVCICVVWFFYFFFIGLGFFYNKK